MQWDGEIPHISPDLYLYVSKCTHCKDLINLALVLKRIPKLKVMLEGWNQKGQNDKIRHLLEFKLFFESYNTEQIKWVIDLGATC